MSADKLILTLGLVAVLMIAAAAVIGFLLGASHVRCG